MEISLDTYWGGRRNSSGRETVGHALVKVLRGGDVPGRYISADAEAPRSSISRIWRHRQLYRYSPRAHHVVEHFQ